MYRKVKAYMMENKMIGQKEAVIAGVSGGGDSMCLLHMLHRLQRELDFFLYAVHVHHGLRGEEADRDEALVQKTCEEWEIPFFAYHYPVDELSKEWKMGIEETGRLVRKEAFQKEIRRQDLNGITVHIALAHNKNDLAETMLHHLSRGSGLKGLSGMRPSEGAIIRPVLCLSRREIGDYLKEEKIPHILDSSNLSDDYTRNRIRHHIVPLLEEEVNSQALEHMAQAAGIFAQAEDYLSMQGEKLLDSCVRDKNGYVLGEAFFKEAPIVQAYGVMAGFFRLCGKRKDLTAVHVQVVLDLYKKQTGRQVHLPHAMAAERTYEGVRLFAAEERAAGKRTVGNRTAGSCAEETSAAGTFLAENAAVYEICFNGETKTPLGCLHARIFSYDNEKIEEKTYTKWLDYDKIKCKPCIRTRQQGDFLIVNREGSHKKLNRCMIDEKIPREKRDSIPLVTAGQEVLWIVGGRLSENCKITPETRRVLELHYEGGTNYHG